MSYRDYSRIADAEEIEEESNTLKEISTVPPHILAALGEDQSVEEKYGDAIKEIVSSRWQTILQKGCDEKLVQDIIKKYKIPENCKLLEAPKLNLEVIAALNEASKNRDKTLQEKQQELGISLTLLGHAISYLLEEEHDIPKILTYLSDAGRLLCSLHFHNTKVRKQLISPLLDKGFLKMTELVIRDEFLFGENLSEKIKNNKMIEKSGEQIKKSLPVPKPSTSYRNVGNWNGPPRQHIQGRTTTRGGQKRQPASASFRGKIPPTNSRRPPPGRPERTSQRARPRR